MSRPWKYNAEKDRFECVAAGCTYHHKEPLTVQRHAIKAHGYQKQEKKAAGGHQHAFRLLRPSVEIERQAIQACYTKVCACGEVEE